MSWPLRAARPWRLAALTGKYVRLIVAVFTAAACAIPGTAHVAPLTPEQLAGQRVIYSYSGLTPPQSLLDRIRAGRAAGVIFFRDNISSPSQIASVVQQLVQANEESPVRAPLLLMTDQEGGLVRRLPGEPESSQKEIGSSADPAAAARAAGTAAARNLVSAGMNVNLAPVLDVYRSPGDFADRYGRSYSADPAVVGELATAFVTAQQAAGVAATAKHFPGLGPASATENTDLRPVTLDTALPALRSVDEAPYPAVIGAGVKLIMVSWAKYPALDPARPAGLSPIVVREELRGRLGFTGVTVTDALEAKSLTGFGGTAQRAVSAATAGMDLILCSGHDPAQGDEAANALAEAYRSGQLDRADFVAAANRVTNLRTSLA